MKSLEDYARRLYHVIMKSAEHYSRCDIVTDRSLSDSLKERVQENRSSDGLAFLLNDSTLFPANFETDFLTNVTEKNNLVEYLLKNPLSFAFLIHRLIRNENALCTANCKHKIILIVQK